MTDEELLAMLNNRPLAAGRKVRFCVPSFMYYKTKHYQSSPTAFPTISITAGTCTLGCRHCGGKVLDTMLPATTPNELLELCVKLKQTGSAGCLISGGCLSDGSVPLGDFISTIGTIKRELGLTVLVHTGIIDFQTAKALKDCGVDAALIDIIGSDETIKEICKLDATVADYSSSLKALQDSGISFVPHIIVGLQYGKLGGELKALKLISRYRPSALVIIAFMPVHGTKMEGVDPPSSVDIARVTLTARIMFPKAPLALGCMRPKSRNRSETEILVMKAGVDAVAFPTEEAVRFAKEQGFELSFSSLCCSQIY